MTDSDRSRYSDAIRMIATGLNTLADVLAVDSKIEKLETQVEKAIEDTTKIETTSMCIDNTTNIPEKTPLPTLREQCKKLIVELSIINRNKVVEILKDVNAKNLPGVTDENLNKLHRSLEEMKANVA